MQASVELIIHANPRNAAPIMCDRLDIGGVINRVPREIGEVMHRVQSHTAKIVVEVLTFKRPLRSKHPF